MQEQHINQQTQAIQQLSQRLFVFHAWQNLPALGPDGIMFHLDTRELDADNETFDAGTGLRAGVGYLKRLRLLPLTATQKANINNREGFSVTNQFLGGVQSNGQAVGMSNMSSSSRTNVEPKWSYPGEKADEMQYTFGKYGLIQVRSLVGYDAQSEASCRKVFRAVMSGLSDRTLLEDLPEYFGEQSLYLMDKPPARFAMTAQQAIDMASQASGVKVGDETIKFTAAELAMAESLIVELAASAMQTHTAALDPEANGILAQTREGMQTGQKRSYDKCDQWLMAQFPSFPMDTQLEKSNKQIMRALDRGEPEQVAMSDGFVPVSEVQAMLKEALAEQAAAFDSRLQEVEAKQAAATPAPAAPPVAPPANPAAT